MPGQTRERVRVAIYKVLENGKPMKKDEFIHKLAVLLENGEIIADLINAAIHEMQENKELNLGEADGVEVIWLSTKSP